MALSWDNANYRMWALPLNESQIKKQNIDLSWSLPFKPLDSLTEAETSIANHVALPLSSLFSCPLFVSVLLSNHHASRLQQFNVGIHLFLQLQ